MVEMLTAAQFCRIPTQLGYKSRRCIIYLQTNRALLIMKSSLVLYLACSVYSSFPSASFAKQPLPLKISNIQNTEKTQEAGCQFREKGQTKGFVFWSGSDESALMNVDSKDTVLKLVSEIPSVQSVEKKGGQSTLIYKSGKMTVRIDRVATRVCSGQEMDCTGTDYNAKIMVSNDYRQKVISVTGYCGC